MTTELISETKDPLAKLPALARRLGVAPLAKDKVGYIVLVTQQGERYDLNDLMHAFLDRLDALA